MSETLPERIWAKVHGASTDVISGKRGLLGGWNEHARDGQTEYVRADRIEALEREVAEAEKANRAMAQNGLDLANSWQSRAEAAEADKARLSEALRPFAAVSSLFDHMNDDGGSVLVNVRLGDLRAARAALSGSGPGWPVPDGWKLVPVEPDDAMIEAGQDTCEEKNSWGGRVYASDIWESMLAASPAAPQQGGE